VLGRIREMPLQFPEVGQGVRRALLRRFPYGVYFREGPGQVSFGVEVNEALAKEESPPEVAQMQEPSTGAQRGAEGGS
jgi:hypothetical protein